LKTKFEKQQFKNESAEMRMIRWMCGVKITDRFTCSELRERLGIDYIITVIQLHRLRWSGHVLRKDENDWVKMKKVHGF